MRISGTKMAEVWSMDLTPKGRLFRIKLKPHKRYNTVLKTWMTPQDVNLMGIRIGSRVYYREIENRIRIRGVCKKSANG